MFFRSHSINLAACILIFFSVLSAPADSIRLVKDINQNLKTAEKEFGFLGDLIFFPEYDEEHGLELWISDKTPSGTMLLKDINPGPMSSTPKHFYAHDEVLYFTANDGVHGWELWRSDATEGGTWMIKDIAPGLSGSEPRNFGYFNGLIYFSASDLEHGRELWRTDGTEEGTELYLDIYEGENSSYPSDLTVLNDDLYFIARKEGIPDSLWKINHETETASVMYAGSESYGAFNLIIFAGELYFETYIYIDNSLHNRLLKFKQTDQVEEIFVAREIDDLTPADDVIYFVGGERRQNELWRTDGTTSGTKLVRDIYPGEDSSYPENLTEYNGILYFFANDGVNGRTLWKSDGTSPGTHIAEDFVFPKEDSQIYQLTRLGESLLLSVKNSDELQVWETNPESETLENIISLFPATDHGLVIGQFSGFPLEKPKYLTSSIGNTLFFLANDGVHGLELWKTDGTEASTQLVKDIHPPRDKITQIDEMVSHDGHLYFVAGDGVHGTELWRSDGTTSGTYMVKDIFVGEESSNPSSFTPYNNMLYFLAEYRDETRKRWTGIWKTDGTASGTVNIKDFDSEIIEFGGIYLERYMNKSLFEAGNVLVFFSDESQTRGYEMWHSDGTNAGTYFLKNVGSKIKLNSVGGSVTWSIARMNGDVYFPGIDYDTGINLWKTDGTEEGTVLVKDINPDGWGSNITSMVATEDFLFFSAEHPVYGIELYVSDGTEAGTKVVKDIYPGKAGSRPEQFTLIGQTLYFLVPVGNHAGLWKSDGTERGTKLVSSDDHNTIAIRPDLLMRSGGNLYYSEIWGDTILRSDGTSDGTEIICTLSHESFPVPFASSGLKLYFVSTDYAHGRELWVKDVTHEDIQGLIQQGIEPDEADLQDGDVNGDGAINVADIIRFIDQQQQPD